MLKLTHDEISVLRWLRDSRGEGAITGYAFCANNRFGVADRLIEAGYVKDQADSFNPNSESAHLVWAKRRPALAHAVMAPPTMGRVFINRIGR